MEVILLSNVVCTAHCDMIITTCNQRNQQCYNLFSHSTFYMGAGSGVVVKALRY